MRDIVRKLLNPLAFIQTDAQHPRIDENFKETSLYRNVHYFIKWSIISILIGTSVGSVGAIFARAIEFATTFWMGHSYALFLLPISSCWGGCTERNKFSFELYFYGRRDYIEDGTAHFCLFCAHPFGQWVGGTRRCGSSDWWKPWKFICTYF